MAEQRGGFEATAGVLLSIGGAALIIVGTIGTWAKASAGLFERSVSGLDTDDGKIMIIVGVAALLFALIAAQRTASRGSSWLVALFGVGAAVIAAIDISDVADRVSDAEASSDLIDASVGWGLIVCAVGGGVAILGGLVRAGEVARRGPVEAEVTCPFCQSSISAAATVCPQCRRDLPSRVLAPPPAGTKEGWLPDPSGRHPDRWWDGSAWTKWVRDMPGGKRSEDPPVPSTP